MSSKGSSAMQQWQKKRELKRKKQQLVDKQQNLVEGISEALNSIVFRMAGLISFEQFSVELETHQQRVLKLKDSLNIDQVKDVYQEYWNRVHSSLVSPLIEKGMFTQKELDNLREAQLEWLLTFKLKDFLLPNIDNDELSRQWAPDLSGVEYTYVEQIRVNVPKKINNFQNLRKLEESLSSERKGLSFAGMMFGNRGPEPISPTWAAINSGSIRPNGYAAGAGWPSHRALELPEVLDIGAIDGRNLFGWDIPTPQGLMFPYNNLYAGSSEDSYYEMTTIAGNIASIDLDSTGRKAAVIEHWGDSQSWVAIVEVETGARQYLYSSAALTGSTNIQFSPAADWILVSQDKEQLLIRSNDGAVLNLPIDNALTAGWWPHHSAATIGVLLHTDSGLQLASFCCETTQLNLLGPVKYPKSDLAEDEQVYTNLVMHPFKNVALVGAHEGLSSSYRKQYGSGERVALLNLDSREISPLADPFIGSGAGNWLERCHSSWRWVEPAPPIPVSPHDQLVSQAESVQCGEPDNTEIVGSNASDFVNVILKALGIPDDLPWLRPELLRAAEASLRYDYQKEVADSLEDLSVLTSETLQHAAAEHGPDQKQWPRSVSSIATFSHGLSLVLSGRSDEIDWAADRRE